MPEISPELAARIETLKASHAENPARFFMPLASAYREAGEVGRAEDLLRDNLKRHPGYLSAHVLLGRCLADRGAYAEARNEFQYVLSVDAQNLIALRTLGDMAAAGGDPGEARRWYTELLSVDPMNQEARQAVAAIENAPPAPPAAPPPADEQGGFGMVEIAAHAPEADLPDAGHADPGAWGAISLDEPAAPPPASQSPATADDGFDALDFGAVDLSVADEQPEQSASSQAASAQPEPAANAGGFDAWGSVDDGQMDLHSDDVEPLPLESFYDEPAAGPAAAPHDDHEEHGEVVTETIAELYAQQGFPDRAAEVYRELISRRGDETALVRRLEELEAQLAAGSQSPAADDTAGGQDDGFAPIDLEMPSAQPPAQAAAGAGEAAPSWLESVDAFVAGGDEQPADAGAGGHELPAPELGGDFDLPDAVELPPHPPLPSYGDQPSFGETPSFGEAPSFGEVPSFEDAPSFQQEEETEPAHAYASARASASGSTGGASTGDAFADSFADGFEGAGRREWEAPTVEETAPTPELEQAAAAEQPQVSEPEPAFAAADEPPATGLAGFDLPAADTSVDSSTDAAAPSAAETPDAPAAGRVTIAAYLGAILSWRPGAAQAQATGTAEAPPAAEASPAAGLPSAAEAQPGVEDAAAPPPARPWDDETLGAPEQQPPMDEPWIAGTPSASAPAAEAPWSAEPSEEPWTAASGEPQARDAAADPWAAPEAETQPQAGPQPEAAEEPWAAPAAEPRGEAGDEPWNAPAGGDEDQTEDLPWMSTEPAPTETAPGTEPAAGGAASGDAPMPWESSFDLSPEVPVEPVADRAPPRQEPSAEPAGGFSFEDFFNEQPATPPEPEPRAAAPAPAPAFEPAPAPAPPAQPASPQAQQGGDDDEDLESFQAWLQSLKR
ncbi:MAG TPA: tetratricopeptide repeat protein [Longimicrobium sp.]|nr:tetratricopeptide repeat protein [Longimicrobium sp.]